MADPSTLHVEARKKISRVLNSELRACTLRGKYPILGEGVVWGWQFAEILEKHLGRFITNIDAFYRLHDFVTSAVGEIPDGDREKVRLLSEHLSSDQMASLSTRILEFVDSLPKAYRVFLRLGRIESLPWTELTLGVDICLRHVSSTSTETKYRADRRNRLGRLLGDKTDHYEPFYENAVILEVKTRGFARKDPRSAAIAEAWEIIREVLFAGKAIGLFNSERRAGAFGPPKETLFFLEETEPSSIELEEVDFDHRVREHLGRYAVSPLDEVPLRRDVIFASHARRIATLLDRAKAADADPVRAGALWGFLSETMDNDTLKFLHTCIGIEAILGLDSDKQGVTELLADRCGFLLGENRSTRSFWKEQFKAMYDVRSKVVHGRRRKLQKKELRQLAVAELILVELIKTETKSL